MITYKYVYTIYCILYTFKSLLVRHLYDSDPKRAARGLNQGRKALQRVNVGHVKFGTLSVGELLSKWRWIWSWIEMKVPRSMWNQTICDHCEPKLWKLFPSQRHFWARDVFKWTSVFSRGKTTNSFLKRDLSSAKFSERASRMLGRKRVSQPFSQGVSRRSCWQWWMFTDIMWPPKW